MTRYRDPLIKSSQITPESFFLNRRQALAVMGLGVGASLSSQAKATASGGELNYRPASGAFTAADEKLTPFEHATTYNNFYEFGTAKGDPAKRGSRLTLNPWKVEIDGLVSKPGVYDFDELLRWGDLEERVYRLRCVEAWSMVIPWIGLELADILRRVEPLSTAKYVRFESVYRPDEMPGQSSIFKSIEYPYVEGLRLDEALNSLSFLAVGAYGKHLLPQNGAPLRLVVPWKYGFKSIKSIVKITLQAEPPKTTWQKSAPNEYGFYANVNPAVSHPRWSQARERRLPGGLFSTNIIDTQLFNGYAEQVGDMYAGMDLTRHF